jgi:hypothetical protein
MERSQCGGARLSLILRAITRGSIAGFGIRGAILRLCRIALKGPRTKTMNFLSDGLSSDGMDAQSGICTKVYDVFSGWRKIGRVSQSARAEPFKLLEIMRGGIE